MKRTLIILSILTVLLIAALTGTVLTSHAQQTTQTQRVHCGAIVIGAKQPCIQYQHTVPLAFTDHGVWSQQVWVPQTWSFKYICDGASPIDQFDVTDEYNTAHGVAWEVYARHVSLVCDNQWHTMTFHFRYAHSIQIGVSRPVNASILR